MAASTVRDDSFARLYSSITIVQTIARLMVGPFFAYGFEAALRLELLGLPFFVVAAAYFVAALMFVKTMYRVS
jgi:hypothetical protein